MLWHIVPKFCILALYTLSYTSSYSVHIHKLNDGAYVKVLEFQSFCHFFLHFSFVYHTYKAPYSKSS